MRLTGAILKQSNSTGQIRPSPWLNLRRKPELDLLPLELDFLYGTIPLSQGLFSPNEINVQFVVNRMTCEQIE